MKKSAWPLVYERLLPFIEDAARTYDPPDNEKGFKFWAVSQVLMDSDFSDDQLREPLFLDGRGDLGLDGYYEEDSDDRTLILIQSKFHEQPTAIGNDQLNNFYSSLKKVLDPQIVVAAKNPLAQDAHRACRDAIANGWTIRFVFLTSGYLSPEGVLYAERYATDSEVIDSVEISKELEVFIF